MVVGEWWMVVGEWWMARGEWMGAGAAATGPGVSMACMSRSAGGVLGAEASTASTASRALPCLAAWPPGAEEGGVKSTPLSSLDTLAGTRVARGSGWLVGTTSLLLVGTTSLPL